MKWQRDAFTITTILIFLVSAVFLASYNSVFVNVQAQSSSDGVDFSVGDACTNIGESQGNYYCGFDSKWHEKKDNGEQCDNEFECKLDSCIENKCQDKEIGFAGNFSESDLDDNFFCAFFDIFCSDDNNPVCGDDICNGNETHATCSDDCAEGEEGGDDGGNPPGNSVNIMIYSPKAIEYKTKSIPLQVADKNNRIRVWKYQLNNGNEVTFVPNTTITASEGLNTLKVIGLKSNFASTRYIKVVTFTVVTGSTVSSYCGDGACTSGSGETQATCPEDCKPLDVCNNNGICEDSQGETENTCSSDCATESFEEVNPLFIWFIIILIILILVTLILIIFAIRGKEESEQTPKIPPPMRPSPVLQKPVVAPISPVKSKTAKAKTSKAKLSPQPKARTPNVVNKSSNVTLLDKSAPKSSPSGTSSSSGKYIYKGKKYFPQ